MLESNPRLLLIDTCGAEGSIALACFLPVAQVVGTRSLPGRSASERLLPAIQELTSGSDPGLWALGAIAVVHGPGSFTGVRVGLSAAKGLSEALQVPLIAISRLAVLASKAQPYCLALLDAGRGEFYAGQYRGEACDGEALFNREQVMSNLAAHPALKIAVCEPGVADKFADCQRLVSVPPLTAAEVLPIALSRLRAGEFQDVAAVEANYVRRTDAEIFAKPARVPFALI